MAKNTDTEVGTGSFPTMGTSASQLSRVAKPVKGRSRPSGNSKGGSTYPEANKANKGRSSERMGATLHPTTTLVTQNATEASSTLSRVIQMPSRGSWTDNFRARSTYGRTLT